jgi:hypothetical protein
MAWNKESKASRRARVAKQLRDKHGKWIEMGGGIKWFKDGKWHNGTATAFKGNNVEVTMEDGSKQYVNHREVEPIRAKGSLDAKPAKPTGSVQAKKTKKSSDKSSIKVRDNDPAKRLTTNADDLEEGDEVHLVGKGYGISDSDAAKMEDDGFDIGLDDKDEPIRARVVDTSGDKVTVEDSNGKRHEIDKKDNVLADDPEVDAAIQNAEEGEAKADLSKKLELDGLDLSEDDKKRINDAQTGEEALKALKESDAGDYLPIARKNQNKAFVDAYRKAVNDINDKHQVVEKKEAEKPAEEKKSSGTPIESLQKTLENLNEDLGDIDKESLEGDEEASAIADATYDFKADSGEVFNLNGSRDENGDWNIAVSDSDGNEVATLNPKDHKSSQELAQAIKNSVEDKSSSNDSGAPTEEPQAPENKPEAPEPKDSDKAAPEADKADEKPAEDKAPLDKALKDAGFSDDDIEKIKNAKDETEAEKEFFQSESGKKASDKQIADKKTSPEYEAARKAFEDFKNEKFPTGKAESDKKVEQNKADQERRKQEDSPEARADRAKDSIDRQREFEKNKKAENTDEKKLAEIDRKIAAGEKMIDDAKKKDNQPLADRIQENVDNLKKQREKLAPSEDKKADEAPASDEKSDSSAPGEPYEVPENGIAPLSEKNLQKTSADRMKVGDKFIAQRYSEGKNKGQLTPITGGDVRVKPDGESWEIKDIKQDGQKKTWEVENSKGDKESITISPNPESGEVARRKMIVSDSEKNRDMLGLNKKKSENDSSKEDTKPAEDEAPKSEDAPADEAPKSEDSGDEAPKADEAPTESDKKEEDAPADSENEAEEKKLADDAEKEMPAEEETQTDSEPTEGSADKNIQSAVDEAAFYINEDNGESWEDKKDRAWEVPDSDGMYVAIGERSTEDNKFLGLYDKDNNELETYELKDSNGRESGTDEGRADSDGGSLDRGNGDGADGSGDGSQNGDRTGLKEANLEDYRKRSTDLIDQVKNDEEGSLNKSVQLDDEGYSLSWEDNGRGLLRYNLKDRDGNSIMRFGRSLENKDYASRLKSVRDAHGQLTYAYAHDKDSNERNVTPTSDMMRIADIGTRFTKDDTTYTKISPVSWGYANSKNPNNIQGVTDRSVFYAGSGEWKLGHTFDDHKSAAEIDKMSDEELNAAIADADARIHGVIAKDGPIGDKGNMGRNVTQDDLDAMQRLRFEALTIHDEAKQYSQRLWDRKKGDVLNAEPIDTGEFNSSAPNAVRDGSMNGDTWVKLRNEYVGLDHRTLKHNFELRNSEKPSRGAIAWGNKMDKWAGSSALETDSTFYRSVLASPETTSQWKPGTVFIDKGVMSVGSDKQLAEIYLENREPRTAGKVPAVFTIEAPAGTKITQADQTPDGEYVAPRGSKLFISKVEEDENGVLQITARMNPSDEEMAAWTNKSSSEDSSVPTEAPETPESTLKPLKKLPPNASNAETQAFAEEYWEERQHLTPERLRKFEAVEKATEDMELEQLDAEERNDFAEANRLEAEIDRLRSDLQDEIIANRAERISGKASKVETKTEPKKETPSTHETPTESDVPSTAPSEGSEFAAGHVVDHPKHGRGTIQRVEGNGKYARVTFDKYDDPKKTYGVALTKLTQTGESKTSTGPDDKKTIVFPGESTAAVGAWSIGERVNHGKHGVGTIQRLEGNGEFARVHFDKDGDNPKRTYGVKLTKLGKGESGTPSSFKDPSTKVGDQKPKEKVNSGTTATRNVLQKDDKGNPFIPGKNDAPLYIGAVVIHPKFGRGRVVKLENNGKYARIVFDNDPLQQPRGIVGSKLEDLGVEEKVDKSGFVPYKQK